MAPKLPRSPYEIRVCRANELHALQQFINEHWRRNHPLAVSRELMDWQHLDRETGTYNFFIARHRSGAIHAILGFIPTSQFDPALAAENNIWLAIWKVREDVHAPGLGLELMLSLLRTRKPRMIASIGISKMVIPMYKALRFSIGVLPHFYLANPKLKEFRLLAGVERRLKGRRTSINSLTLRRIQAAGFERLAPIFEQENRGIAPRKSLAYFRRRYLEHPIYRYEVLGWKKGNKTVGFFIIRRAVHDGASAVRIVDFHGAPAHFAGLGPALLDLLDQTGAEYLDFYNVGVESRYLNAAGLIRRSTLTNVIVPNHFEPFSRENVEIDFAFKLADVVPFSAVKGDADQDRPNVAS